jgi:hypothetical protein
MSCSQGLRLLVLGLVWAGLTGCATSRILKCEGHLVPINPPKAVAPSGPASKGHVLRGSERKP